jgi:DNA-nicking Smr family endonuclease
VSKKRKKADAADAKPAPKAFGGFHALADKLGPLKKAAPAKAIAPEPPPEKAPPTRTSPIDDADDSVSFHRLMSGVRPLERGPERTTVDVARERTAVEADAAVERLRALVDDGVRFEVSDDGDHVEGRRLDTPPALVRSLRRGALPIDARLDLHGLGAAEAKTRTLAFLCEMRGRGERCVLVIHGKGEGVLRGELTAWLSQGRARDHVAAFVTAHADDGGGGALYVALRR